MNGKPFINIGTEKACLFLNLSRRLIKVLEQNEFLYFAIEEGLKCASQGYYAAGILAYSQCLNCLGIETPGARHRVAHEFLRHTPSLKDYEAILGTLKYAAEVAYIQEADKHDGDRDNFHKELYASWEKFIKKIKS